MKKKRKLLIASQTRPDPMTTSAPLQPPPPPRKRATKYPFILKDVDIAKVCRNYGMVYTPHVKAATLPKCGVTHLEELIPDPITSTGFAYMDETRNKKKCVVTMVDYQTRENIQLKTLSLSCFWCRHAFDTLPIGCPVKYIPNMAIKHYFSRITKDMYTIREEVSVEKFEELKANTPPDVTLVDNDYYEVDGVFCSFNCCLAFIRDNTANTLYANSVELLHDIYNSCFSTSTHKILPAPHWRMLTNYGGPMSIDHFRDSFTKTVYEKSHVVKCLSKTKPIGMVYDESLML